MSGSSAARGHVCDITGRSDGTAWRGVDDVTGSHRVLAVRAIILAAGRGSRLAPMTDDRPKPLVDVLGRSLLLRTLDRLRSVGIQDRDIVIVTGYRADMIDAVMEREQLRCVRVFNPRWHDWNNFYSLLIAREAVGGEGFLQFDGDVVFDDQVLPRMLGARDGAALAVDVRRDLDAEPMKAVVGPDGYLRELSKAVDPARALGEYIGVTRLDAASAACIFDDLARFEAEGLTHEYYDHAYHRVAAAGQVRIGIVDISDCEALEVDDLADLARAEARLAHRT
ncbi:MAG: phosphocholine cytidylyltransferase family protein [Nannocystis sp.]|uniref:phosphocholine cytidylyltransferase family protein n=1 Tax=Nannocystis sp. TaxID=1962667 RepID=UPI0024287FE6|nr:phosphocholine cytidylyltransferase family protein [Nannocystis sp.]MBK9757262.1 phosphocholine cytidylyltransferase family protein [Nannocystis sp.]